MVAGDTGEGLHTCGSAAGAACDFACVAVPCCGDAFLRGNDSLTDSAITAFCLACCGTGGSYSLIGNRTMGLRDSGTTEGASALVITVPLVCVSVFVLLADEGQSLIDSILS